MNIDILEISELKWTEMGEFISDDHCISYCGQEFPPFPLLSKERKWRSPIVNKRVRNAAPGCNLKNDRMISVAFQGKPFNITVVQVLPSTRSNKSILKEINLEYSLEGLMLKLKLYFGYLM